MYSCGLRIYWLCAFVFSFFNKKASYFVKGRYGILRKIKRAIPWGSHPVWFHCASLGEFEQGRPLIEKYRETHPFEKILLTFFSPSGYEARKNYGGADYIFYMPLDTWCNAHRFLKIVQPSKAIFIKYEYWFNYLKLLKKNSVPTYVASAIFLHSQVFFKWYGAIYRRLLKCFTKLFVQNQESVNLLKEIGVENGVVCGDTRFDRVRHLVDDNRTPQNLIDHFNSTKAFTFIAGSSWPDDEEHLLQLLKCYPTIHLVLAPHEIHAQHIKSIETLFADYSPVLYSKYHNAQTGDTPIPTCRVLVIDCIGILSSIYRYADLAYVGGGFNPSGIHNTLEAATYGKAIIIGPNYNKFQEAKDLVSIGAVGSYSTFEQLKAQFSKWIAIKESDIVPAQALLDAGKKAHDYVASHLGATDRILAHI